MSQAQTAQALELSGDIVAALRIYREMYQADDSDEDAILGIANCALALDELPAALDFFVRLLIRNHDNAWGYLGRSNVLFRYGQDACALSDVASALKLDSPATFLRIDAAAILNANGYPQNAFTSLAPIRASFSDDPDFKVELASCLIAMRCLEDADLVDILGYFEAHLEEDPLYEVCILTVAVLRGDEKAREKLDVLTQSDEDLRERVARFGVEFPAA